jgi:hypothetical protein
VHTGVGVRLTRRSVELIWIPEESCIKSYGRALGSFFLFHMPLPGQMDAQHQLASHHKRILRYQKELKGNADTDLSLEDIYSIILGDDKSSAKKYGFKIYAPPRQNVQGSM